MKITNIEVLSVEWSYHCTFCGHYPVTAINGDEDPENFVEMLAACKDHESDLDVMVKFLQRDPASTRHHHGLTEEERAHLNQTARERSN